MNLIEQVKARITLRRRVRKVARARAEISAFADQIRRLGDHPGFLAGISDEEAHHRVELLLGRAEEPAVAVQVAFEIYGKEGLDVYEDAKLLEGLRAMARTAQQAGMSARQLASNIERFGDAFRAAGESFVRNLRKFRGNA